MCFLCQGWREPDHNGSITLLFFTGIITAIIAAAPFARHSHTQVETHSYKDAQISRKCLQLQKRNLWNLIPYHYSPLADKRRRALLSKTVISLAGYWIETFESINIMSPFESYTENVKSISPIAEWYHRATGVSGSMDLLTPYTCYKETGVSTYGPQLTLCPNLANAQRHLLF